ncbi:MAG: T9SS type A sorting domain-containing protein [Bacteroidales bacterium]|nr:T9SS type A sorting domain-containing protein [Bacteroidales bacterium]
MKKLIISFMTLCLAGIISARAQSSSDSSFVRDLNYDTLNLSSLPASIPDTLRSHTASCKILKDLREGAWAKGYNFTISSDTTFSFKMFSNFDCYLFLLDSNYNEITHNDDWTNHSSSSIIVSRLKPGKYFIIATQYGQHDTSINKAYNLVVDYVNAVGFSGLNYTAKTFLTPITDTLSNNSRLLNATTYDYRLIANRANGYTIQAPLCNLKVAWTDAGNRVAIILDSNYNQLQNYYQLNDSTILVQLTQAGTYRIVMSSTKFFEDEAASSLSKPFTITTDTVNVATTTTLTYRNINIGDTVTDSIVNTDPYLILSSLFSNRSSYAKGYRIHTNANIDYFDSRILADSINGLTSLILLDSNFNELASASGDSYAPRYAKLFHHMSPLTTYYLIVFANHANTGSYRFLTKSVSDTSIRTFYVDAINGNDDSSGLTPASALATIGAAVINGEGIARIYLTEDYSIGNMPVMLDQYTEIYPYQKNIRFIPQGTSTSPMFYGQTLVLGKNNDSLYFLMDSLNTNRTLGSGTNMEINNLKIRNTSTSEGLVSAQNLIIRNSEISNCLMNDDDLFLLGNTLTMINTTISNNIISGQLLFSINFTMENSTISNNKMGNSLLIFYNPLFKVNLISGNLSNNTVFSDNELIASTAAIGGDSINLGGMILVNGASCNWGAGFSIDTNNYVFLDSTSRIILSENITAPVAARIYPFVYYESTETIRSNYYEGRSLLEGPANILATNYSHFSVAQPAGQTWYLHNDGKIYTSEPVGINVADEGTVNIYPNPATDMLNIALEGTTVNEVIIIDIYGKTVARRAVTNGYNSLNINGLPAGMYFVQLRADNDVKATKKLIKR